MSRGAVRLLLALTLWGAPPGSVAFGQADAESPSVVPADTLVGLWKARRWFGPWARGPVVVERTESGLVADLMAMRLPVHEEGGELRFELPEGEGGFRGRIREDGAIRGIWFPGPSVAMGGRATPLTLAPRSAGRWAGEIDPFDDVFSFWLRVEKEPDGALRPLLRNYERDFGALLRPDRLEVEGSEVRLLGQPPWEREAVVVSRGSYDPEQDVLTLSIPARGGAYHFVRDDDRSDFWPRGRDPESYAYRAPPLRDDGWPVGTVEDAGVDRPAIEAAVRTLVEMPMDSVNAPQIHALLVARHGRLVLEEYFHGMHRDYLHDTRSASKSVTAAIVGAALEAGATVALSTPVYETMMDGPLPGDLDPRKRAMTLEHLLTMTSGYFCDDSNSEAPGNEDGMWDQSEEPDFYRYTLAVPMAYAPGDTAIYCSANPNLALGVVGRATGEWPAHAFDRLVAEPLGIERYAWTTDPAGNPYGGGSLLLRPRDFLKFGQLMLNGGTWEGRRILSEAFVESATSPLYRIGDRGYGYLWWTQEIVSGNRTFTVHSMLGAGGQTVNVVPELDLVVASMGGSYSSRGWRYFLAEFVPELLLPAVR